MSSLFADTHNVVAILEKSDAVEGFEQIIDFLGGSYIHYALTVSPHIYISCIKQFWNTASVKRSSDVTRLQAQVDKKKIVISEAVIREILQLNDAEGVVCLPNEEIFAGLAQMGYEKPSKFYMYPRFIQLIIQNQVGDLSTHTTRFISPALTQKVFANMRRVGKGFSGVETPLFEGMFVTVQPAEEGLVADQVPVDAAVGAAVEAHVAEDVSHDVIPSPSPHLKVRVKRLEKANKIKYSKLRRLRKVGTSRRVESSDDMEDVFNQGRMIADMDMNEGIELIKDAKVAESEGRNDAEHAEKQAKIYNLDLDHSSKVLSMQEDDLEVQEVVKVVTTAKLITEVVTAVALQVSATSTTIPGASATIPAAKPTIPAVAPTVVAAYTRRRKGVIIRDPEEELPLETPAKTPKVKDKGEGILVESPKPMKKKDQIEMDAEYARKLQEEIDRDHDGFNKDIDWDAAMDHVNLKSNNPQFDENIKFLFKSREEMEAEDQEIIKSINETPAQKAAKRRKLSEEAQEAEDLRKHLEVVENQDDDVFVEATPLAQKVPIVDYQIVLINNKPRFKIIRADETHQFYINFATLLKNFDREDLETLWRIVKDRFSTSKPTNFSDEYLLLTLRIMFEEPDGQDAIWRNQKSVHGLALVKRWKLLTLCGVHVITLSTVEEESEMSLELRRVEVWGVSFACRVARGRGQGRWTVSGEKKASSENRPPMLNKENYVPWSSRLLRYAKSRPNGKLTHNSIINGSHVRRMIPELGDTNREVLVNETFYVQTDEELTEKELKQIEADDQAIQTILLGLPEDIYAAVDSCETARKSGYEFSK
nr:ribonuclease H-like domain-containing protein [Tanacetum cinerariifolium]